MNKNLNLTCVDETAHLEHLSSQLNYLLINSIEELAKKIGDCVFDSERLFLAEKEELIDLYLEITDKYAKHLDDIIAKSYYETIKKFELAMSEYKTHITTALNQTKNYT